MTASAQPSFASLLRRLRDEAGLTQDELAQRARLGTRTVSNLERGVNVAPHRATVRRLAEALDLTDEERRHLHVVARRSDVRSRQDTPDGDAAGGTGVPLAVARTSRAGRTGGFLGATPPTRLVARRTELKRALDALDHVLAGTGRLVLLTGEAGIGKTRLAQEVGSHAERAGCLVASGRCYDAHRDVALYPFLELLEDLLAAVGVDERRALLERWPEAQRLVPDLVEPPDPGEATAGPTRPRGTAGAAAAAAAAAGAEPLLRAVTGVVNDLAARRPLALLLDDLHLADSASVDLLAHLVRHTTGAPVLVLGTYRDVEVGPDSRLRRAVHDLHREHLRERVEVALLDVDETADLLSDRLAGTPPAGLAAVVHARTGGNPFFTVEVLRALVERGDVHRVGAHWVSREGGTVGAIAPPASVSDAIGERVSRLAAPTQQLLEDASVLGQSFDVADLQELVGLDDLVVEAAAEEAESSGLLRPAQETERADYSFDHALSREALYARLSPARRSRLHRVAGEVLERRRPVAGRRRAAEIAAHFAQARMAARALPFHVLAGQEAEATYAPDEAERQYRAALDVADDLGDAPAHAQALELLGGLLSTTARHDEALAVLDRASSAYRAVGDPDGLNRTEARLAFTHLRQGTDQQGTIRLTAHLTALDSPHATPGERRSMIALYCELARLQIHRRRHTLALHAAERAALLAREEGAPVLLAEADLLVGSALVWRGEVDAGVDALERARAAPSAPGSQSSQWARLALALVHTARADLDEALVVAVEGVDEARRAQDSLMLTAFLAREGMAHLAAGRWGRARTVLDEAAEIADAAEVSLFSSQPALCRAVLLRHQGDEEGVRADLEQAALLLSGSRAPEQQGHLACRLAEQELDRDDPAAAIRLLEPRTDDGRWTYEVSLLALLAEAHLDAGDLARARTTVEGALQRAEVVPDRLDGLEARRVLARVLAHEGRHVDAVAVLLDAVADARALRLPHAAGRLLLTHARLLADRGEDPREPARAAVEVLDGLGAHPEAARARALVAQGRG